MRDHQTDDLVGTLEVFLDLGCNARRTADALKLHRTTLYYRLRKIEEVLGIDLEDGSDRLALHLGLKLARLGGLLKGDMGKTPAVREEADEERPTPSRR